MRITHVVVTDAFAGVEAHVCRLARGQAAIGHEVTVVGGRAPDMRRAAGATVEILPGTSVHEARRSLARTARPEIVHAHMTAAELASCLYAPVARRRVPLVATRHFALVRGRSMGGRVAARLIRSTVATQISISEFTRGRVDGPSSVVVAGVENRSDVPTAAARRPVVLVAARLEAEKRVDLGVRAFAAAGLVAEGWRLQIAGSGSRRPSIERLVADLGLDDAVDLLGHRSDVAELMAEASIFLAPTPGEHFGLSVLEAMAAGTPVVADRSGGHLESLGRDGEAGLFATGDVDDAARRLRALATDTALRDDQAARLRTRQRTCFSLEHQVTETVNVYRSVLR